MVKETNLRVIAIDGPAASGKSTIGCILAEKLGFLLLDTGCMYRATTLAALKSGVAVADETAVTKDVRRLTKQVSDMMRPPEGERVPKVVRFQWGTFMFDGLIESIEESLEYFSPEGVPLRASLSFSMVQQSLDMAFAELADDNAATGTDTPAPGTQPTAQTQAGETMQGFQQRTGLPRKTLKEKARQNGIENLRRLEPMQRIETAVRTAKQPRRAIERTQQDWLEFAQERGLPTPPDTPKLPDLPTTPNLPDIGL